MKVTKGKYRRFILYIYIDIDTVTSLKQGFVEYVW